MGKPSKHSPEVQERAVRLALESRSQHESERAAITSVAGKMPWACGASRGGSYKVATVADEAA